MIDFFKERNEYLYSASMHETDQKLQWIILHRYKNKIISNKVHNLHKY